MTNSNNYKKTRRLINVFLFVFFMLFAIVQLNDPDPVIWFTIYGLVAFVFLYANYKSVPTKIIWTIQLGLLVYASFHFHLFVDWLKIDHKEELFGEMVYEKPYLEGTREFLGLILAVLALIYPLKNPISK